MAGHENRAFNQAAGALYCDAIVAAEMLARMLPGLPAKPELPNWPLSPRALAWCTAIIASAHAGTSPAVGEAHAALAEALARWRELLRSTGKRPPMLGYELRELHRLVPPAKGRTVEGDLAAGIDAGILRDLQAAHWRRSCPIAWCRSARAS